MKLLDDPAQLAQTTLTLVTTGRASNDSVAGRLRPDQNRNETAALEGLRATSNTSNSKSNKAAYEAFKSLSLEQQTLLVSRVQVLDQHLNVIDIERKLLGEFRVYTLQAKSLFSRLEGWWLSRAIKHLVSPDQIHTLTGRELMLETGQLEGDLGVVQTLFHFILDVVAGLAPHFQVIISDHANLKEDMRFQDAVREVWRGDDALIPRDWIEYYARAQAEAGLEVEEGEG